MTAGSSTTYDLPGLFRLPDLVAAVEAATSVVDVVRDRPRRERSTYLDAADLRLVRAGATLEHRTGESSGWTLQLPSAPGAGPGGGGSAGELRAPGSVTAPPEALLELLTAHLRGAELQPAAVISTSLTRNVLLGVDAVPLAELVEETVSLLDGRHVVSRSRRLHVASLDGRPEVARVAEAAALAAGAVPADHVPDLVRALGPRAQSTVADAEPATADTPAADLVRLALRTGLARLLAADVGVRRGEPDAVHQLRVACRRLRSDLRSYAALLDDERVPGLREELAWLADTQGDTRDLEVLRARLARTAQLDPLAPLDPAAVAAVDDALGVEEERGRSAGRAALRSTRYVALLDVLVAVAEEPRTTPLAEARSGDVLPGLVAAPWAQLARRAARLRRSGRRRPDDEWHRARILAKRARYAAEAAAVALGPAARRTAGAAQAAQEHLGEHQDAAIAAERFLALADRHPDDARLALTLGRLVERERAAVRAARAAFRETWTDELAATPRWLRP